MYLYRRDWLVDIRRFAVSLLCVVLLVPAIVAAPEPEEADAASPCDVAFIATACDAAAKGKDLVSGGADVLADGSKGLVGKIGKEVGDQVGKAVENASKGVFDQLTSWVGEAASWFFLKVTALISKTTSPNLFQGQFTKKYSQILGIAAVLAIAVAAVAAADGARRGDLGGVLTLMLQRVPLAVLGMVVAVTLIQMSLNIVDAMSAGVAKSASVDIEAWFKTGAEWMSNSVQDNAATVASPGVGNVDAKVKGAGEIAAPGFVMLLSSLLGVIGALGLWLELLMRDAAIYICAVFFPLSLAASLWPSWSGVMKKTFEILVVLVISKFFMVFVVALGASFLGKPDSVEAVMAGSMMMIAAVITPYFLYKVIPFMEGAAIGRGAAGLSRSGMTAVSTGSQMTMMRNNWSRMGGGAGKSGGGASRPSHGSQGPSQLGKVGRAAGGAAKAAAGSSGATAAIGAAGGASAGSVASKAVPRPSTRGVATEATQGAASPSQGQQSPIPPESRTAGSTQSGGSCSTPSSSEAGGKSARPVPRPTAPERASGAPSVDAPTQPPPQRIVSPDRGNEPKVSPPKTAGPPKPGGINE